MAAVAFSYFVFARPTVLGSVSDFKSEFKNYRCSLVVMEWNEKTKEDVENYFEKVIEIILNSPT